MIALLMAGGLALATSLVGTRYLIAWLVEHRIGQPIREEGPKGHQTKAGTPTMGGIAIVIGAVVGYTMAHIRSRVVFTRSGMLVLALVVGAGIVGFLDDWIAIKRERNLGLNKRMKVLGLLTVALLFAALVLDDPGGDVLRVDVAIADGSQKVIQFVIAEELAHCLEAQVGR